MFNKKRIAELEWEVDNLKTDLKWRTKDIDILKRGYYDLEKAHKDLVTFLGIKNKECKPGLEYIKND